MNVISWIVFGLIVGVIANLVDRRPARGGLLGAVLLGILGSLVGGFIGQLFFGTTITGFNFVSFVLAVAGAIILLIIGRAFSSREV